MPDGNDMLQAIAEERALRLRARATRCKAAVAMLVAAAACIVAIAWWLHDDQPPALAEEQVPGLSIEDAIAEASDPYADFPSIDWDYWLGVNPSIVGWMTVRGTGVDAPIAMAEPDAPTFYLSHGIDGSADGRGCIFLDAECEAGLESMHCVVYGHNWDNGLVFSDIADFADPAFAASRNEILLQTPSWKSRLSVQCVELANGTDSTNVIAFPSASEMGAWYRERFSASEIQLTPFPTSEDEPERIYTFCTCADGKEDRRVLVYAIPETNERAASRAAASTA